MGMAELVDAPVLLVGDIDKGGVFASLAGTMLLLRDEEKSRVKGTIINKFRGDVEILKPGLTMIQDIIKIPCMAVVPYFKLSLEDEDGAVEFNRKVTAPIDIAVIKLPHISNFTDFDALQTEEDVSVRFITSPEEFGTPDLLILPGSKNTIEDLVFLREKGYEKLIKEYSKNGLVMGICGGYQMLGNSLSDPYKVETELGTVSGMGLLNLDTVFEKEKVTTRVEAEMVQDKALSVYGYEIHMGISSYGEGTVPLFRIVNSNGSKSNSLDGAVNETGNIMGTYIHGVFDGVSFRQITLNKIREKKGLELKQSGPYESLREKELDKLADIVRSSLDMNRIYEIMELK
jgi:adenosylcobyric acid synthase